MERKERKRTGSLLSSLTPPPSSKKVASSSPGHTEPLDVLERTAVGLNVQLDLLRESHQSLVRAYDEKFPLMKNNTAYTFYYDSTAHERPLLVKAIYPQADGPGNPECRSINDAAKILVPYEGKRSFQLEDFIHASPDNLASDFNLSLLSATCIAALQQQPVRALVADLIENFGRRISYRVDQQGASFPGWLPVTISSGKLVCSIFEHPSLAAIKMVHVVSELFEVSVFRTAKGTSFFDSRAVHISAVNMQMGSPLRSFFAHELEEDLLIGKFLHDELPQKDYYPRAALPESAPNIEEDIRTYLGEERCSRQHARCEFLSALLKLPVWLPNWLRHLRHIDFRDPAVQVCMPLPPSAHTPHTVHHQSPQPPPPPIPPPHTHTHTLYRYKFVCINKQIGAFKPKDTQCAPFLPSLVIPKISKKHLIG
jgi:hypothetical protein